MKKYILLISLCISASSYAQEKLILGFDAGSIVAGEHRTYAISGLSYSMQPDYLFGIEAGYGFSDQFGVRMQMFIEQRTISAHRYFERVDSATSQIYSYTETGGGSNTFLEIPLTAKYNFFSGRSHAYIFAGPVVGFVFESGTPNFGIVGGAGYSRDLTHIITFFAETGYTIGFANLSSENYYKSFARDFRINAGLLFNIGLPLEISY